MTTSILSRSFASRASSGGRVRRALQRGVTLVEVLIVVAIIAMVAGGVAVLAIPKFKEAQISSAKTAARVIRTAVQQWQMSNSEYGTCPTVSQLIQDKQLDPGQNTDDPWGQAFVISCGEDSVSVMSFGPDKKQGTKDDISVPEGAAAAAE